MGVRIAVKDGKESNLEKLLKSAASKRGVVYVTLKCGKYALKKAVGC